MIVDTGGWGIRCGCVSPDGETIVTGHNDGTLRLWNSDCPSPQVEPFRVLQGHEGAALCVAFSPDGRLLASGAETVILRHTDGRELARLDGHAGRVVRVAFSPDGRRLLTAGDRTARVWITDTQELLRLAEQRLPVVLRVEDE